MWFFAQFPYDDIYQYQKRSSILCWLFQAYGPALLSRKWSDGTFTDDRQQACNFFDNWKLPFTAQRFLQPLTSPFRLTSTQFTLTFQITWLLQKMHSENMCLKSWGYLQSLVSKSPCLLIVLWLYGALLENKHGSGLWKGIHKKMKC